MVPTLASATVGLMFFEIVELDNFFAMRAFDVKVKVYFLKSFAGHGLDA